MLGSTRLQSFFGAVRPGTNTAGTNTLKAVLKGFAQEGMAIMFLEPGGKAPADYRTDKQKKDAEKLAESRGEKPKSGLYLATSDTKTLNQYLKNARKQLDGPDNDPNAIGGLTPLNFGIVPDKSRVVVVDCDTKAETDAFRNWYMDHTSDTEAAHNMDMVQPSVLSPGSVRGGQWQVVEDEFIDDDFGTPIYHPPVYQNVGGNTVHANGGHWYFFYPEDYELPEGAKTKISILYDAAPRTEILDRIRDLKSQLMFAQDDDTEHRIQQQLEEAEEELQQVKQRAQYYFDNPRETRDDNGKVKDGFATFVIMLHSCYVLIPPSSRHEGHYRASAGTGDLQWEPWLEELIASGADDSSPTPTPSPAPSQEGNAPLVVDKPSPQTQPSSVQQGGQIDEYAAVTSFGEDNLNDIISTWAWPTRWQEILCPHGWIDTGMKDNCGCDIFTAPGPHESKKSATAHDNGCELGCSELGRLHIWTDNPPEEFLDLMLYENKRDYSKMSVKALLDYDGDNAAAIRGEGLELPVLDGYSTMDPGFATFLRDYMDRSVMPAGDGDLIPAAKMMAERRARNKVTFTALKDLHEVEPPKFMVADTLEENSFSAIIGPSGSGKSFAAIDLAEALATGGYWMGKKCRKKKVGYLAGEGMVGVIARFQAWEEVHGKDTGDTVFIADKLPNINSFDWMDFNALADTIKENNIDVIIIDTWSRAIAGADENAAEDTSRVISTLDDMRQRAGCSIVAIHHTGKESITARGSSVFNAALDTEILVQKEEDPDEEQNRKLLSIKVTKQKNTEQWEEPRYCQIVKSGEDTIEFDDEGFPVKTQAPAVIGDLNGNFGSADGLGGAWFLDENELRSHNSVPLPATVDILSAIKDAVDNRARLGATDKEIIRVVVEKFSFGSSASFKLREEVTRLFDAAVRYRLVGHKSGTTSKFVPIREGVAQNSPQEVVDILAQARRGEDED